MQHSLQRQCISLQPRELSLSDPSLHHICVNLSTRECANAIMLLNIDTIIILDLYTRPPLLKYVNVRRRARAREIEAESAFVLIRARAGSLKTFRISAGFEFFRSAG